MFLELKRDEELILARLISRRLRELQTEALPTEPATPCTAERDTDSVGEVRQLCELLSRLEEAEYDVLC